MSAPKSSHNSVHNSEHGDDYVEDPDPITSISKLDISNPLHLHPNDSTTLTMVSIKLKGTENYQVLHIQDIEDMLLLLVQGKLTNLTVEERLAFNVSLRIFTRSFVIQRRVEDLQLGVESYQKKLNLTKSDTVSDTLNDVRTALDDRLKGIRMKYLPQTIWRQSDRDKAGAMI
ncbi:hypothetical protein Tco_0241418 [Tanacetum coccineum]